MNVEEILGTLKHLSANINQVIWELETASTLAMNTSETQTTVFKSVEEGK